MRHDRSSARLAVSGWPWLLALLVTAPLLAPGFVLSYDMVFVPRQDLLPASLGLSGPLPRAVPMDAVVALATTVVPGQVLQKVVLVGLLAMAGWGAARLVPTDSLAARTAAASWYVWNPYVAERLVLGHWALLVGYASLPWLVRAAWAVRSGDQARAEVGLLAALVPSALVPSGGLVALLTVVPVLLVRPGRREWRALGLVVGAWTLLNAPWWLPGLLHPGRGLSGSTGGEVFAARAEGVVGTIGSLLGLGGVWNAEVVPTSRELGAAAIWLVLVLVVAGFGVRPLVRATGPGGVGLLVAAGTGLVLAAAGALPGLSDALGWVVQSVPGGGLLRDGQKLVAPLAVAESVAFGLGCVRLTERLSQTPGRALRTMLVLVPLLAMPDLAWGVAGRLQPVPYPGDWSSVRSALAQHPDSGDVVSLPWQAFRAFGWNDRRVLLDPAPRYLPTTVVVDDTLLVGGVAVSGEDPRAAEVDAALATGRPAVETLPALGVGWLLVEHGTPGAVDPGLLDGAATVYAGHDLTLLRLAPTTSPPLPAWAPAVVVVDVVALLLAVVLVACVAWSNLRRGRAPTARVRTAIEPPSEVP